MLAVIYRFKLKPHQEQEYRALWNALVSYFKEECGATGSVLHKDKDNLYVAYSRWPDKKTRDAAWPGKNNPNKKLPPKIQETIIQMQKIAKENEDLEQFEEICLDVLDDRLPIN